ncbi:hypothetical protein [Mesorhizobium sp.]|uniref:hypothetical protein n=1 Tax=Mesorhizobium sp. TaxID=1871066 RepID=UPI0025C25109|nr:hypothetical protein [Mesorhizobium sp.]
MELTSLAREAHDEVNPRINAVIEFYEDAETVAGADAGVQRRAIPSQERAQRTFGAVSSGSAENAIRWLAGANFQTVSNAFIGPSHLFNAVQSRDIVLPTAVVTADGRVY